MFENLTDRLQDIFGKMGRKGKLTEQDVDEVMREVKLAMLEADVNFKVVKDFINRLKERAIGAEVLQSLSPAQQVVKIVNEELIAMLGEPGKLDYGSRSPAVIMLVGLQGSGKTTTAAKLGLYLRKGDMLSLIERAEATFDQKQGEALERKLRAGGFDLEDFLQQLQQIKKMGPLSQILEMIPGMRNLTRNADMPQVDDAQIKRIEAIINSMTIAERRNPAILDASRRRRIARGSGTTVQEINALLNQFKQMQKMMKQLSAGRMPRCSLGWGAKRRHGPPPSRRPRR